MKLPVVEEGASDAYLIYFHLFLAALFWVTDVSAVVQAWIYVKYVDWRHELKPPNESFGQFRDVPRCV